MTLQLLRINYYVLYAYHRNISIAISSDRS